MSTTASPADARFAEIQARAQESFVGRLRAIYDKDKEALLQWVGSQQVYDAAVDAIENGTVAFVEEPSRDNLTLRLEETLLDSAACVVGLVTARGTSVDTQARRSIYIWFPSDEATLKLAAQWREGTPMQVLEDQCDLLSREVTP